MELLEEKKRPLDKNSIYIKNNIKIQYSLKNENNNSLGEFLNLLNEKFNLMLKETEKYIENCVNLDKTINLIKMEKEDIEKIISNNKLLLPTSVNFNEIQFNNDTKELKTDVETYKKVPKKMYVKFEKLSIKKEPEFRKFIKNVKYKV